MGAETFGERLKRLRLARGLSQRKLAPAAGLTNGTISQAESGDLYVDQLPSHDILRRLAKALDVPIEVLAGEVEEVCPWYEMATDEELMERAGITVAPAHLAAYVEGLSLHAGEKGSPILQDLEDTFGRVLEVQAQRGDPIRWFRVFGKCMEPKIDDGDWVYIDREMPIEPGKFVAAVIFGEQAVARKLVKKNGRFWLATLDGAPPVLITDGIRVIGRIRHRQSTFA